MNLDAEDGGGAAGGRGPTLFWRVFLVNATILVGDGLLIAVSPPIVNSPPSFGDAIVIVMGLSLMLVVNYTLMRHAFGPLHRLRERVAGVQRLDCDQQLPHDSSVREVADLTRAFNEMLVRLEDERHRSDAQTRVVRERERWRLSRELHDEVGQMLSGALLLLETTGTPASAAADRRCAEVADIIREALEGARRVAHALRPEILEELALGPALANLGRRTEAVAGFEIDIAVPRVLPPLSEDVELAVYRIAQEAMTNVVRHARASRAALAVGVTEATLTLTVSDDGVGRATGVPDGNGLKGMRERASGIGADLVVCDASPQGTALELRVPLFEERGGA